MGYSARETLRYLKRRFGVTVPEKTFRLWYTAHKPICTYHTIRDKIKRRLEPAGLIEKHYLQHRQVYLYTLHHGKLAHLFAYLSHRAYGPMREYLSSVTPQTFPHELFTPDTPLRSSTYPVRLSAHVTRKENYATKLAPLAVVCSLRPAWMILQGFLYRYQCTLAKFVEVTSRDAILAGDMRGFFSPEECQHRLQAVLVLRWNRVAVIEHRKCLTSEVELGYTAFRRRPGERNG